MMSWSKTSRPQRADRTGRSWQASEMDALAAAVRRAPSVHNTQPWALRIYGREATVLERPDPELSKHDPEGRDRFISCGAAVANLLLAVRGIGWAVDVVWFDDAERADPPDAIATVIGAARRESTATEGQRYRAITRRFSYREPFAEQAVPQATRETLRAAATSPSVYARWVTGADEASTLARLLAYAARVHHDDAAYQRELMAWTTPSARDSAEGIPESALGTRGVPAVGLTTRRTRLPEEATLASGIEREAVLVLSTPRADRGGHLRVGEAMELAWLSATSLGLVASVMTQPLRLDEVRSGVSDELGLPGVPEVLIRFGYPAVDVTRSSRRSASDLVEGE